jgi:RNA polymerase sigma-B factor
MGSLEISLSTTAEAADTALDQAEPEHLAEVTVHPAALRGCAIGRTALAADNPEHISPTALRLLPQEHPKILFKRAAEGDSLAREKLIMDYMPLARALALRYSYSSESVEDIMQIANLGLVKAVDRFDPSRGTVFSTYAVPTILGEIKRHFRDHTWMVRVPRVIQERLLKINKAMKRPETARLSEAELAFELGMSEEELREAKEVFTHTYRVDSLDGPSRKFSIDDAAADTLGDLIGDPKATAEFDNKIERVDLHAAINKLPDPRMRRIVELRLEDKTQAEIAQKVGLSQMHISRILRKAIACLAESCAA